MAKTLEQLSFISAHHVDEQKNDGAELDWQIRELARQCQMPSAYIGLDYRTEPSFFSALSAFGHEHELVLIKPPNYTALAGLGIRSSRYSYLHGKPATVGYLHHLRFHPDIRGGSFLVRGYKEFRRICAEKPLPLTLTSILEDNIQARQLLESSRVDGFMPAYQPISRFLTAMIPLTGLGGRWPIKHRQAAKSKSYSCRCLQSSDLPALLHLFAEWGKANDGAPSLGPEDLTNKRHSLYPGLSIADIMGVFLNGELLGAMGVWNQQSYRQIVLSHLCPILAAARNLWNMGKSIIGDCPVPATGNKVNFLLLDPWAFKPGHERQTMPILLNAAIREAQRRGAKFAAIGVAEKSTLINAVKTVFFIPYWSIIYQVVWPETVVFEFSSKLHLCNLGAL